MTLSRPNYGPKEMDWNQLLASTKGRLSLKRFWLVALILYGLAALILVSAYYAAVLYRVFHLHEFIVIVGCVLSMQFFLMCAPIIKRLHDLDLSGWWLVPVWILPQMYLASGDQLLQLIFSSPAQISRTVGIAVFVLAVWSFLALFVMAGTAGANRFGADPVPARVRRRFWFEAILARITPRPGFPCAPATPSPAALPV